MKYQKYTKRFEDLIKFYEEEIKPKRKFVETVYHSDDYYKYDQEDLDLIQKWLINVETILQIVFGKESLQIKTFDSIRKSEKTRFARKIHKIKGLLEGSKEDLENGFLLGQEFIIANEVFDSVLEEAKFFIFEQKNKDIGAILLRIVLEDAIKRIAKKEDLVIEGKKISVLNNELKSNNYFIQTTWRQNQAWLDIGNEAAHGNFEKYDSSQVENFYKGLVNFLSFHFS